MKFSALVFGSLILSAAALPQLHAQNYVISTFAGGGAPLQAPAPALTVPLGYFVGIATDATGNVYLASPILNCVFKLDQNGVLTRAAGSGRGGYSGDGGPATEAQLNSPGSVAVDGTGNLFIGEVDRVRRVSPSGIITTIAGNGQPTYSGDGGPAADAQLSVTALAMDNSGNLFVADPFNHRIRKITPDGLVATIAGNGSNGSSGDNGPASAAQLSNPHGVAADSAGNVFIADGPVVRKVSAGGIITTVAGGGSTPSGDGGPATSAYLSPQGVTTDDAGNLYIGDGGRLRKVTPDGIISTVGGNVTVTGAGTYGYSGDGGPATSAQLENVTAVALDSAQALWIADGQRVRRISADGIITTVAGNAAAACCFSGDGGPATGAQLSFPSDVAVDAAGNVFIADTGNHRIRRVSPDGVISTVTASAQQWGLYALTVDSKGNLLVVDIPNNVIRQVALDGSSQYEPSGDGGPLNNATFVLPSSVAFDPAGNFFIADFGRNNIRKVTPDAVITTVAGNGSWGASGDGGLSTSASLNGPSGIAADGAGNIYIADTYNNSVRVLRPTTLTAMIKTILDAASQQAGPLSPGKVVTIYGLGLGPSQLTQNQPTAGVGTTLNGTTVTFNGVAAPILYTSSMQVGAVVPYAVTGQTAQVTVSYQGQVSNAISMPSSPRSA